MAGIYEELKRRNVVRIGIAYVVTAWLVLQVADLVVGNVPAPDWVMQMWMNSPGHCRNIMHPGYVHLGVGYYVPSDEAAYQDQWTQVFGTPR